MISPTGLGIRNDSKGSGVYGAKRGNRMHRGTDYFGHRFQNVVAPFDMFIKRISIPTSKSKMSGIAWMTQYAEGRMFYFEVKPELIGTMVEAGQVIGKLQDITTEYSEDMDCHLHFQYNSIDPEILAGLTEILGKI